MIFKDGSIDSKTMFQAEKYIEYIFNKNITKIQCII